MPVLTFKNARSVCNKTLVIKDFVVDHAVDLLGIMETWLHLKGDDVTIGEFCRVVTVLFILQDRLKLVEVWDFSTNKAFILRHNCASILLDHLNVWTLHYKS